MSVFSDIKTVCVFGAGALGGAIAARLAMAPELSDIKVSVVARGDHLSAIQRGGLRLLEKGKPGPATVRVVATADPEELGPQDLVITALKGHQLPSAARGIAMLLHPTTCVLMVQNGIPWWYFYADRNSSHEGEHIAVLDPQNSLWDLIGPERVIGCIAFHGATVTAPGEIQLTSEGKFVIGEPSGVLSPALNATASLLEAAGWTVARSSRIRDEIWLKLMGNASFNPIGTLTRANLTEMVDDPSVANVARDVMNEIRAVGEALGVRLEVSTDERIALARKMGPIRSSMLQDFERGRPLEITPLLEAVLVLARMTAIPTPTLNVLFALISRLQKSCLFT